jgi:hypothetical protein
VKKWCGRDTALAVCRPSHVNRPAPNQTGLQPGIAVQEAGGSSAGVLLAAEGMLGLAYLKLAPALAAAQGSGGGSRGGGSSGGVQLHLAGDAGAWVRPVRPGWWPVEWGHEEAAL